MKLPVASSVLLLAVVCLPSIINSLTYENSVPLSPEMYSFFHPNTQQQNTRNGNLCDSSQSDCSDQFPTAANVQSNVAYESGGVRLGGGGGMTGIPIGLVFAILLGIVIVVVVITRKRNSSEANASQLNV